MKHFYGVSLLTAVCLAACTPDDEFTRSNGQMGLLGFSVGVTDDNDASATRSESYVVDTFVLDGDTLSLVCTVTDMDAPAPEVEETSATRGTPIYTRDDYHNLETVYGEFNVSAFKVDGSGNLSDFMPNYVDPATQKTVDPAKPGLQPFVNIPYSYPTGSAYEDDTYHRHWEYWTADDAADDYYWWEDANHTENNYNLAFYAYAPTGTVNTGKAKWADDALGKSNFKKDGIIEFTYTVPVGSGSDVDLDAEVQPDILVGYTAPQLRENLETVSITSGGETKEYYFVDLIFYHALCGVNFKATENLATNEHGLTINSITLSGLKGKGDCTFNPAGNASGKNKSYDKISWDFTSYTANDGEYTQKFNYTVPETTGANKFNDAKDQKDATLYGAEEGTGASKNFMLIPQSFGTATGVDSPNATFSFTYTYHDVTKTKEIPLFHKNSSSTVTTYAWEAGKLYTYEIQKIAGSVDVEVIESFSSPYQTKSNVNVKNIGLSNAYVRAAVIANWVDDNGVIVAPCEPTFTPGTNWYKSSDGFYYYKNKIKPGNAPANNLIGSYTAPTSPVSGAHLEMHVVGQGIDASTTPSSIYVYWSGASSAGLTTTLEP